MINSYSYPLLLFGRCCIIEPETENKGVLIMTDSAENNAAQPKRPKHRSPNYPSISVEKAMDLVRKQHQSDGLQQIPASIAHQRWGYAPNTGRAHLREAALKAYGLIDVLGLGKSRKIRVSERADRIIRQHPEYEAIIREVALSPIVYREIWEHYKGILPQDDVLQQYLIWEKGFNDKSVARFISQFRATISFAKLTEGSISPAKDDANGADGDGNGGSDGPPKPPISSSPSERLKKMQAENIQQPDFRELKFLLPSGEAVLFVPMQMLEGDFNILETYLDAYKRASGVVSNAGQPDSDSDSKENEE